VLGPLGFSHGGAITPRKGVLQAAPLRLEQERNRPNVRERLHGIFFAGAPDNAIGALSARGRRHALRISLAAPIIARGGGGALLVRHFTVDAARVPHSPVHFSLPTENANREAPALHHPWRSSRLSKRRAQARDAAEHQRSAGLSFLRYLPSDFRAADAGRLCRAGLRLRVLRYAPLCDASFPNETRHVVVAETVSSSPSLQR
jgi:hypothetical protein